MSENELISIASSAVKELSKDFDEVAVKLVVREAVMVKLWNSEPSVTQSWMTNYVSIYLAKNKRIFELRLRVSNVQDVLRVARNVLNYVDLMSESELYAPLPEPTSTKASGRAVDEGVVKAMEAPSDIMYEAVSSAMNYGGIDRVAGTLSLDIERKVLVTSKGFEGYEEGTGMMLYLRAFSGEDSGHWAFGSRYLDIKEVRRVGELAAKYATMCRGRQASLEPGKYDVILSPLVVGNLMNYVAFMASGLYALMGFSIFMNKKPGERVASSKFTLKDVPRETKLPNSSSFDDEGIATYDKPIIDKGVFTGYLHNTKTASKLGGKSTGNAGWTAPMPWNVEVLPGDYREDELISEVKRGLLITNNWYTRLQNYVEGIFSTVSRDAVILVENGEPKARLHRIRVSDTLPNLLRSIDAISKNQYLIKWWEVEIPSKVPYILVHNVGITKPFA